MHFSFMQDIVEDAVFYEDGGTRFQQGELGVHDYHTAVPSGFWERGETKLKIKPLFALFRNTSTMTN